MVFEDNLDEERADQLADQLDEEDAGLNLEFRLQYIPEDPRSSPCSEGDIEALNRILSEKYFSNYCM